MPEKCLQDRLREHCDAGLDNSGLLAEALSCIENLENQLMEIHEALDCAVYDKESKE